MFAAAEQCDARLLFQLDQLPGQGGLDQMQQIGRPGDILFPGGHEKVFQHTDLYGISLLLIQE